MAPSDGAMKPPIIVRAKPPKRTRRAKPEAATEASGTPRPMIVTAGKTKAPRAARPTLPRDELDRRAAAAEALFRKVAGRPP